MKKLVILVLAGLIMIAAGACGANDGVQQAGKEGKKIMKTDMAGSKAVQEGNKVIHLAGGCFWGLEQLTQSIPGVVDATSGYANGQEGHMPTYESVVTGTTGYRETVRVEYNPREISLDAILFAYFRVIDSTVENQQGNDRGTQYQTGVYYDDDSKETVERIVAIEKQRSKDFAVEIEPLARFYTAEEYHQDYLDKNPNGYCHIAKEEMEMVRAMIVDPGDYPRPDNETIKTMLTEEQYRITQQSGTEVPFSCEYWDNHAHGLYVDIVTGEPLFSSSDKYVSGTGWPSFSRLVDPNTVVLLTDTSHGLVRTEVRSRAGNSHLGHVFFGESESPSGERYCVNSAALRFIPYDDMEAEGYGYLIEYVTK